MTKLLRRYGLLDNLKDHLFYRPVFNTFTFFVGVLITPKRRKC